MTEKPQVDFEEVVKASGMPVTESEVRERFNAIADDEGIITNTSRMSPFWRLITAIVTAPVMWLKDVLVSTVLANMFVATASGSMLRLLAWAVNVTAKPASAAEGVIRFVKEDARAVVTVKAGTVIQTERINGRNGVAPVFREDANPTAVPTLRPCCRARKADFGMRPRRSSRRPFPAHQRMKRKL